MKSKDRNVRAAARSYGNLGEKNGVKVKFDPNATWGTTAQDRGAHNKPLRTVTVTLPTAATGDKTLIAHEGSHVVDFKNIVQHHEHITHYQSEFKAYETQGAAWTSDFPVGSPYGFAAFQDGQASMTLMQPVDDTARQVNEDEINGFLANSPHYGYTEQHQGGPAYVPVP